MVEKYTHTFGRLAEQFKELDRDADQFLTDHLWEMMVLAGKALFNVLKNPPEMLARCPDHLRHPPLGWASGHDENGQDFETGKAEFWDRYWLEALKWLHNDQLDSLLRIGLLGRVCVYPGSWGLETPDPASQIGDDPKANRRFEHDVIDASVAACRFLDDLLSELTEAHTQEGDGEPHVPVRPGAQGEPVATNGIEKSELAAQGEVVKVEIEEQGEWSMPMSLVALGNCFSDMSYRKVKAMLLRYGLRNFGDNRQMWEFRLDLMPTNLRKVFEQNQLKKPRQ